MKFAILFLLPLFTVNEMSSARGADTYAFVTQTTNASSLSYLNPLNGKQVGGRALGIGTNSGAVYSSDGTLAFVTETTHAGTTNTIIGYRLTTGKRVGSVTIPILIGAVAVSPTSANLFVIGEAGGPNQGAIYEVNTTNFKATKVFQASAPLVALAVSADGSTIYAATPEALLSISTSTFQQTASVSISGITGIWLSSDPNRVYLSLYYAQPLGSLVACYNPQTQTIIGTFPADSEAYVAISPDGANIYTTVNTGSGHSTLEQVSASTFSVLNSLVVGDLQGSAEAPPLAISPDGSTLSVVVGPVPSITIVSVPALTVNSITPVGNACGVAYPSAREVAVTNCGSDTVDVVDVTTKTLAERFDAGPSPQNVLLGTGGKLLYVSNPYGLWELSAQTGKAYAKYSFPDPSEFLGAQLAISADNTTLFVSYSSGVLAVRISGTGLTGPVPGIPAGFHVSAIATSPDGKYLFVAGDPSSPPDTYQLLLLDQTTGALVSTVNAPARGLFMVSSKDSSVLYYEGIYREALYSLSSFNVANQSFATLPAAVMGGNLALSPDGNTLYTAIMGDEIQAFDTTTLTSTTLPSPVPPLNVAVTPDGLQLVVTSTKSSLGLITIADPLIGATIPVGGATGGISAR